ncbi:MAG: T9SS type A sorting domain-containing protein [Flavobacteriales bacterium]|nr:T9SS type A sorting domain-containing protein [Flavobacteriales bacterium]
MALTTLANLNGTGANTQGNWVTGISYPIIDDAAIANLLEIAYYPTIYRICPNRMITEIGQQTLAAMWTSCQGCDKYRADSPTDGTVLPNLQNDVVCVGGSVDLHVRLQNTGTTPLTSATIEAKRGTTVLGTQNWTGSLNTYDLEDVTITPFTPTAPTNTIVYTITSTDDEPANNTASNTVVGSNTVASSTTVQFTLLTDNYGAETTWKLFDGAGAIAYQDPAGNYANATTYNQTWTLNNDDCYRFEIYDSAGDGVCCGYGIGSYSISANGTNFITGGEFDDIESKPFLTDAATSVEENTLETGLSIYPNPTAGLVNINMDLRSASTVNMTVLNIVGETVMQQAKGFGAGAQRTTLDLSDLAQGSYIVNIVADGMTATRQIAITK